MITVNQRRSKDREENIDRYLALVDWAKRRYTVSGILRLSSGGIPSPYSRIVKAAYERYLA